MDGKTSRGARRADGTRVHLLGVAEHGGPLLNHLVHARIKALPWRQVPVGSLTRDTGHGRAETRALKAAHVSRPDFPRARQAIKITRGARTPPPARPPARPPTPPPA